MYFWTCFRGLDKKTCQWCTTKMLCSWSHTHCIAQNMLQGPCSRHHQNCKLLSTVRLSPSVLQVRPLLKKPSLDQNMLKNYRAVSNLLFLSKLLERVVLLQLTDHVSRNDLLARNQSAYCQKHSSETALLHITNCLLESTDQGRVSILSLLDLSAAFDTIDHSILPERLHTTFGISGSALLTINCSVHTSWTDFKLL